MSASSSASGQGLNLGGRQGPAEDAHFIYGCGQGAGPAQHSALAPAALETHSTEVRRDGARGLLARIAASRGAVAKDHELSRKSHQRAMVPAVVVDGAFGLDGQVPGPLILADMGFETAVDEEKIDLRAIVLAMSLRDQHA